MRRSNNPNRKEISNLDKMATGWKLEDLQELEQYGLATELESANLQEMGGQTEEEFGSYSMSKVLDDLIKEDPSLLGGNSPVPISPLNMSDVQETSDLSDRPLAFTFMAPTAYGVKTNREILTYINRGQPYELRVQSTPVASQTVYRNVLKLSFLELRLKNCERDYFDSWLQEHPMERLIEIVHVGCDGLSNVCNDEGSPNAISFLYQPGRTGIISFKVNCLSTEFSAKKHGGEKGVVLQLIVESCAVTGDGGEGGEGVRVACNIKVFKDKGADRKHKQDQLKVERMAPDIVLQFHPSEEVTMLRRLSPLPPHHPPTLTPFPFSPSSQASPNTSTGSISTVSPFRLTTPSPAAASTNQMRSLTATSSLLDMKEWLSRNRFTSHLSLFANYSSDDLFRLSRHDLVQLCGPADGIRLYNALRSPAVRVIYVAMQPKQVYQALCLEELTAAELCLRVAERLGVPPENMASLLRLTSTGILVHMDDTLVATMRDEQTFLLLTTKEESGRVQVILQDHAPCHAPNQQQDV